MDQTAAQAQLDGFLDKFLPEIAARARGCIARMRTRLPGALELVYDNYQALAVGYAPTERASDAIFSIVVMPTKVSICFTYGAGLPDPHGVLNGAGNQIRHVRLPMPETLDEPALSQTMDIALDHAKVPLDPAQPFRTVIKSISAKQRPRRP